MKLFTDHPHSVGESYLQHFCFAMQFGVLMLCGGIACLLHAFFPFIFQKTGSNILTKMMVDIVNRTPVVSERVVHLSECIDQKMAKKY